MGYRADDTASIKAANISLVPRWMLHVFRRLIVAACLVACDASPSIAVQNPPVIVLGPTDNEVRLARKAVLPLPLWSFHWQPAQGPLLRCAEGYQVTGQAAVDIVRLSLMCGPSTGLRELPTGRHVDPHRISISAGKPTDVALPAEMRCLRVFAAADHDLGTLPPMLRLSLFPRGSTTGEVCEGRAAVICPPEGVWCNEHVTGRKLSVSVVGKSANVAFVSSWGAERPPVLPRSSLTP